MAGSKNHPQFPHGTLSAKSKWSAEAIGGFLEEARLPLRISSIDDQGYPQITSLWFVFEEGKFLCCTQPNAVVSKQIEKNAKVGFEVAVNAPPYYGISGQGEARLIQGDQAALLSELTERYLEDRDTDLKAWLLSRADSEVILEVTPHRLTSWDFRARMSSVPTPR